VIVTVEPAVPTDTLPAPAIVTSPVKEFTVLTPEVIADKEAKINFPESESYFKYALVLLRSESLMSVKVVNVDILGIPESTLLTVILLAISYPLSCI